MAPAYRGRMAGSTVAQTLRAVLRRPVAQRMLAAVVLAGLVALAWFGHGDDVLGLAAVVVAGAWVLGRWVRTRRIHLRTLTERNRAESEARSAATRAMVVEERAGVAGEMQDLVAHALTEVTVQVAAARRTLSRGDPESAATLLAQAEQTGHAAMEEMRRAVDVLGRSDGAAAMRPQPGLADLADLLDRERALGGDVRHTSTGTAVAVPSGVALASYRLVEEVLAGARRDGAVRADVALDWAPDVLKVRVRTTPATARMLWGDESPRTDSGLEGLRHRVEVYGGELRWVRTRDGGAAVTATFPHRVARRAR